MKFLSFGLLLLCLTFPGGQPPYPLDGYEYSGIRRLVRTSKIASGSIKGGKVPPGSMKSINDIHLHLVGSELNLDELDGALQAKLQGVFAKRDASYSIAVLDITPGKPHRLAMVKPDLRYQPGSVGKLAVIAGLFTELSTIYPDDVEARREILRSRMVVGGAWTRPNSHTVPVFDLETGSFSSRSVRETDTFSLFEWADHAVSASSNAAASVVWKEVMLMRAFGESYPPSMEEEAAYFKDTPRKELGNVAISVVNDPLRAIGIDEEAWRLGLFFTTQAGKMVPTSGGSTGTPRALLTFLARVEQGEVVDNWSSLEIKRLMYQTERRIRYAASSSLSDAAVYFKSGSLYKCDKAKNPECTQYKGNVYNYMNSVATVETADGRVYIVALMSNVLNKNSSSEHLALASEIERIMQQD